MEEISGVAFIFNQRFFQELRQETGTNICDVILLQETGTFNCDAVVVHKVEPLTLKPHFVLRLSGIDLENIVYYKDDTHYFVMTAKKQSLLEKGVIKQVNLHT